MCYRVLCALRSCAILQQMTVDVTTGQCVTAFCVLCVLAVHKVPIDVNTGLAAYDCPHCLDRFATAQSLNCHLESHLEVR